MSEASTPSRRLNKWELGAAAILALAGIYLVIQGFNYSVGTFRRMGPGFFPVAVGAGLVVLSVGIMYETRYSTTPPPELAWRPLIAIAGGLFVFALCVSTLGAIPATFLLILLSMAGDTTVTWKKRLIVAISVAVLGYIFFGLLFRLPLSPFWW